MVFVVETIKMICDGSIVFFFSSLLCAYTLFTVKKNLYTLSGLFAFKVVFTVEVFSSWQVILSKYSCTLRR